MRRSRPKPRGSRATCTQSLPSVRSARWFCSRGSRHRRRWSRRRTSSRLLVRRSSSPVRANSESGTRASVSRSPGRGRRTRSSERTSVDPALDVGREVDLQRQVTLLDLLDRMLEKGVVLRGQLVLAIAEVDLVKLDLNVLLGAVDTWERVA